MDVALFHQKLLGLNPLLTPSEYRLTSLHQRLYTAFESHGARGFSGRDVSQAQFLATLVLALYQTRMPDDESTHFVTILLPGSHNQVFGEHLEAFVRYVFRQRKSQVEGVRVLRRAFKSLKQAHKLLQIDEPERWVILGFQADDFLPTWCQGRLV